jgi:hypothetical protein
MTFEVLEIVTHSAQTPGMEAIWDLEWRLFPAAAIAVLAAVLAVHGGRLLLRALRQPIPAPGKNLTWMRGFRLTLLGSSLVSVAAGWLWQQPFFVAAGAVIGFEETLETSIAAWALKQEYEADRLRAPGTASPPPRTGATRGPYTSPEIDRQPAGNADPGGG